MKWKQIENAYLAISAFCGLVKARKRGNKLGLSCDKLRPAEVSFPLVTRKLAYAKAAYYAQLYLLC